MRLMNLEPVIPNEVDHKEKNKYHILTHTYEIYKKIVLMNLLQGRNRDADIDLWTQWGKERVEQMEIAARTHIHCCCYCCQVASVVSNSVRPQRRLNKVGNHRITRGAQPGAL